LESTQPSALPGPFPSRTVFAWYEWYFHDLSVIVWLDVTWRCTHHRHTCHRQDGRRPDSQRWASRSSCAVRACKRPPTPRTLAWCQSSASLPTKSRSSARPPMQRSGARRCKLPTSCVKETMSSPAPLRCAQVQPFYADVASDQRSAVLLMYVSGPLHASSLASATSISGRPGLRDRNERRQNTAS
jgi:hypothetical protein